MLSGNCNYHVLKINDTLQFCLISINTYKAYSIKEILLYDAHINELFLIFCSIKSNLDCAY